MRRPSNDKNPSVAKLGRLPPAHCDDHWIFHDGVAICTQKLCQALDDVHGADQKGILMKNDPVGIIPATSADRSVIAQLIQLYLYDMAAQTPFDIGSDGRYDYALLDDFWRYPYLIYWEKQLVGFALVIDHCPVTGQSPCWFMAEYFVLRPYRGKAIGQRAFAQICARHAGLWHIAVQAQNTLAEGFWAKVVPKTGLPTSAAQFDGAQWRVRAFQMS